MINQSMVNQLMVKQWSSNSAPTRSLATLALGLSKSANIALGLAFVVAALRGCTVLCFFVWSSLVLVAWALTPWVVRPGSLTPWELYSGGSARCRPRCTSLASGRRTASVGSGRHAFPGGGLDQGRGPRHQGYLRVPPGARSSVLPFLGFGQSAVYPGVPSGAAWVRYLVRPGRLRRRRARERWQA